MDVVFVVGVYLEYSPIRVVWYVCLASSSRAGIDQGVATPSPLYTQLALNPATAPQQSNSQDVHLTWNVHITQYVHTLELNWKNCASLCVLYIRFNTKILRLPKCCSKSRILLFVTMWRGDFIMRFFRRAKNWNKGYTV